MNIKKNLYKINLNPINNKLSGEFPNTKIIMIDNEIDSLEIYYNNSKTNKKNNFYTLDGGTKDRIIRRIKLLFKNHGYVVKITKNIIHIK